MIIAHRINTIEELQTLSSDQGIEFDVRDSDGVCIVQHDAFQKGILLDVFLDHVRDQFLIVNIKSEGIEQHVLQSLEKHNCINFFLLDCSLPKIVQLTRVQERRIAVRFSEFESVETVLAFKDNVEWVWVDSFEQLSLSKEIAQKLQESGMKLCLVSPELQGQPEKVEKYIEKLIEENIFVDAVCSKLNKHSYWDTYYIKIKKDFGFFTCHQGWTDIINNAALLNYYVRRYKHLLILIRDDAFELYKVLCRQYKNITILGGPPHFKFDIVPFVINCIRNNALYVYQKNGNLHIALLNDTDKNCKQLKYFTIEDNDYQLIGLLDKHRTDKYNDAFCKYNGPPVHNRTGYVDDKYVFWKKFYSAYDIPYMVRFNHFEIQRDLANEEKLYNKVVHTTPYIVTHLKEQNNLRIPKSEENIILSQTFYELHEMSPEFLDAIKILKNASAMYLIDSVWAILCFHLDVKYRLFKDIKITVYCLRDYDRMFNQPISLPNWTVIPSTALVSP
jgi:hypothetical protein